MKALEDSLNSHTADLLSHPNVSLTGMDSHFLSASPRLPAIATHLHLYVAVDVSISVRLPNTVIPLVSEYGSIDADDKRKQPVGSTDLDEEKTDEPEPEGPPIWRCPVCTFENPGSTECELCGMRKP